MESSVAKETLAMARRFQERITVAPVEQPARSSSGGFDICDPDWPECGGSDWVRNNVPISDPMFGKLSPCPKSNPFKRYGKIMGLSLEERELSWDKVVLDSQSIIKAVSAVKKTLERGYGWVYLWGNYGMAKTLILKVTL